MLINGETFAPSVAPETVTKETPPIPERENDTGLPMQTGLGVATIVAVGAGLTVTPTVLLKKQPLTSEPRMLNELAPEVVGVMATKLAPEGPPTNGELPAVNTVRLPACVSERVTGLLTQTAAGIAMTPPVGA